MAEIPGKEIAKIAERFVEGVPGLALTAILLNIFLDATVPNIARGWIPIPIPIWSISLAWAAEKFGHYADDWLYDPFWEPGGWCKFPKKLGSDREALAKSWHVPVTGLFAKAAHLSKGTDIWEKDVKLWLEFSKAFRSVMFLSVAALLWLAFPWNLILLVLLFASIGKVFNALRSWLSGAALIGLVLHWEVGSAPDWRLLPLAAIFLVSTGIYLAFRIVHNLRLYQKAATIENETRNGFLCMGQRVLPVRRVVLCSPAGSNDPALDDAKAFVQSMALLHVDLRAACGSFRNSKTACYLNLDDVRREWGLKPVNWGEEREPIRVPGIDSVWAQVSPDLAIHFVNNSGVNLKDITKLLNGLF